MNSEVYRLEWNLLSTRFGTRMCNCTRLRAVIVDLEHELGESGEAAKNKSGSQISPLFNH